MTTPIAQLLALAQSQIGYAETGGAGNDSGNVTKYWAALQPSFQGQPWCGAYVSWVFQQAGFPLPAIDHPWGFSYCPDAVNWAKAHGLWSASGHYSPGDVVLYCFDGTGLAGHTGIVVSDDGTNLHTIEGNTSPGMAGSQANGGGVYARVRPHGATVLGVLQASKLLPATAPAPTPSAGGGYSMVYFGARGVDHSTADVLCQVTGSGVATCDVAEAKAALGRGEPVIVCGGPAALALGLTVTQGKTTVSGSAKVCVGATAGQTLLLAAAAAGIA